MKKTLIFSLIGSLVLMIAGWSVYGDPYSKASNFKGMEDRIEYFDKDLKQKITELKQKITELDQSTHVAMDRCKSFLKHAEEFYKETETERLTCEKNLKYCIENGSR